MEWNGDGDFNKFMVLRRINTLDGLLVKSNRTETFTCSFVLFSEHTRVIRLQLVLRRLRLHAIQ